MSAFEWDYSIVPGELRELFLGIDGINPLIHDVFSMAMSRGESREWALITLARAQSELVKRLMKRTAELERNAQQTIVFRSQP